MITDKGKQEILNLIASDLVGTWADAEQALRKALRLLLSTRPDVVRNYFYPGVWEQITGLDQRQAARVIMAGLRATVVEQAGAPEVAEWDQAVFYMGTGVSQYREMARTWARTHADSQERLSTLEGYTPPPLPATTGPRRESHS